jgi:uncharacterized protein (DUF952 family)
VHHPWLLYHLVPSGIWDGAPDPYEPSGFADLGFVHLSTSEQVDVPGRALFSGRQDMLLLVIDRRRLVDEVRFEEGDPPLPGVLFPHLYGRVPHDAVIDVLPYRAPG